MQAARGAGRRVPFSHPCHMVYDREAGSALLSCSQFWLACIPASRVSSTVLPGRGAGPVLPSAIAGDDQGQLIPLL